jgi:putative ABC transport system permease protein
VAVTSIIAVVALIQGMNAKVNEVIVSETGADSFVIQQTGLIRNVEEAEAQRNNPRVTLDDLRAVEGLPSVGVAMAREQANARVVFDDTSVDGIKIEGVTPDYLWFPKYVVDSGRLILPHEVERRRAVALIGADAAEKLFAHESPIGKLVRIDGLHFRVVGVTRKRGAVFGHSQDEYIVIPLGAFEKRYGHQPLQVVVRPKDPQNLEEVMEDARAAVRVHRRLRPLQPDNFGMLDAGTFLDLWHRLTNRIFAVLVGVVVLSLFVGGIVIMNIMLMVVTERTQEVGLRKALGARKKDIVAQILTESVTLSATGGIAGTILGVAAAIAIEKLTPIPAEVSTWSVAVAVAMTVVVGLFFGLHPAIVAARLDPIEAIRRE